MSIRRFLPSTALGLGVTIGTGVLMASLIATEFQPQDKVAALVYDINPVAEDIAEPLDRKPPELMQKVETPPPPPDIEKVKAELPTTKLVETELIPNFVPPVLEREKFVFTVADGDAQPIFRPAPIMPSRANRSGHCTVLFDVSADGMPYNIQTSSCSQKLFERATVKSVQRWKFKPKSSDGINVAMTGLRNKVSYRLTDERGNIIPE